MPEPTEYVVARLREALAHDERVAALDIGVRIVGDDLFLTGAVTTEARRDACEPVVGELLSRHRIHNQLAVLEQRLPSRMEHVT